MGSKAEKIELTLLDGSKIVWNTEEAVKFDLCENADIQREEKSDGTSGFNVRGKTLTITVKWEEGAVQTALQPPAQFRKELCIDFDGVIHSYVSGWKGYAVVHDPPVPGAIEWLTALCADGRFIVNIYSSRSKSNEGIETMRNWLREYGMHRDVLNRIRFPTQKPAAHLTIDDRALCFTGEFPTAEEMLDFKPWYKK